MASDKMDSAESVSQAETVAASPVQDLASDGPSKPEPEDANSTGEIAGSRYETPKRDEDDDCGVYSDDDSDSGHVRYEGTPGLYKTNDVLLEEMKVELWKIDDIYDQGTGERLFAAYDPMRKPLEVDELDSERYSKWALVLRRVFANDNRTIQKTQLDVRSPLIKEILRELVKFERASLDTNSSVPWPNENIFRYRNKIREAAVKKGELAVKHVGVLLELIHTQYESRIKDIENMLPKGTATFKNLGEYFWKNDIIVTSNDRRCYRVMGDPFVCGQYLQINAEAIDFDGHEFGTVLKILQIPDWNGIKYITECEVFPLKYHPSRLALEKHLVDRGSKFVSLKGKQHKVYAGPVLNSGVYIEKQRPTRHNELTEDDEDPVEISSDVVIDTITYNRLVSESGRGRVGIRVSSISDELVDGQLSDEHLLICTDVVPFFSLEDKHWHKGNVVNMKDKVFNEQIFSQLVLPEKTKQLVRALVRNHKRGPGFDDFVKGKGKGLVVLLHGPPGVGKTMTAEAVAEYTHRPLYTVTSSELGITPSQLEESLARVLDTAHSFGAILLLDEADVFLEQRSPHDLKRNALVSIFLRHLEYYKGILFLTTNRIASFDDAFHSRIHITLGYSKHDRPTREQIWRNFAAHMKNGLEEIGEKDFKELSHWELNGRQVKNVLRSSQALAADRGEKINMDDLRTVLEISKIFDTESFASSSNGAGSHPTNNGIKSFVKKPDEWSTVKPTRESGCRW